MFFYFYCNPILSDGVLPLFKIVFLDARKTVKQDMERYLYVYLQWFCSCVAVAITA